MTRHLGKRRIFFRLAIFVLFSAALIFPSQFFGQKGVGNVTVDRLASKEKRWALIIGVDTYQNDITPLYGTVNDAKALRDTLIKNAGFADKQIILMTTGSDDAEMIPTRGNIFYQLDKLKRVVPAGGLILFSFSGHGVSIGSDAFIVPADARIYQDAEAMRDSTIDVLRIKKAIQATKVKQVIMFLDACRNDPLRAKGETDNKLTAAYAKGFSFETANQNIEAYATLYATSLGDRAYEFLDKNSNKHRGYFSYAIEEGLTGAAANGKGEVTLAGLIKYIEDTVKERVHREKDQRQIPYPTTEGFKNSELIIAVSGVVSSVQTNTDSGELSFWSVIEKSTDIEDFENYLRRTKSGEFKGIHRSTAELKIKRLKKLNVPQKEGLPAERNPPPANVEKPNLGDGFVEIRSGTFLMGAGRTERQVAGFFISAKKVTQAQWQLVMLNNPSYLTNCNQCPVENVSRDDIQNFLQKLNVKRDDWAYRLPTEIEWEYAARTGSTLDSIQDLEASVWYAGNSGGKTQPVGVKKANKWKLFDMYGNVMEWTGDSITGSGDKPLGIIRGCSFLDSSDRCTPTERESLSFDSRRGTIGFRLVRFPSSTSKKAGN